MKRAFHATDRDQSMLLPPSLHDWLPDDHLAYFIIDAVAQMDLKPFFARFKDGSGQKAYSPEVMLPLYLFSYCRGVRSSRQIERLCQTDIAYRILACNTFPDHTTIARFRNTFRQEITDLFVRVLELCREAGLGKLGSVAIDGTKIKANAAMEQSKTREKLAEQVEAMLKEAEQADQTEDHQFGAEKRGDEMPEDLRSPASRRAALQAARQRQERLNKALDKADKKAREAAAAYDRKVADQNEREEKTGRPATPSEQPKPPSDKDLNPKANITDPDSDLMKARSGFVQAYNAQAAVTEDQIIIAASIAPVGCDNHQLLPMIDQIEQTLAKAGIEESVKSVTADAGYWGLEQVEEAEASQEHKPLEQQTKFYIAVPKRYQTLEDPKQPLPENASLRVRFEHQQRCPAGQEIYKSRSRTVEPTFGQIKSERSCREFMQRGIEKVKAEWTLMCTVHNLMKLFRVRWA